LINIVFWSPEPGQTGTTSNIIAVAILAALSMGKKVCLTQTHYNNRTLESALLGRGVNQEILEDMGIDFLLKSSKAFAIDKNVIENASFTLLKGLHILPGTTKINEQLYEEDFISNRAYIYDALSRSFDIVFTDVSSGDNKLSKELMQSADKVVVNLNQNDKLIQYYINNFDYLKDKAVYLLGNYHGESRYNLQNIKRCYPFLKKKISTIPFDVNYMDYFNDGKVIPFFLKNTLATREDDRNFFEQVKNSLKFILRICLDKEEEMCC
jgi:MinD-like ATPase involved in chromosome partitioning or flagellar assembly